jgi:integrase
VPRRYQGAKLWLRPARVNKSGRVTQSSVWLIRDRTLERSTGCGPDEIEKAQGKLNDYLTEKRNAAPKRLRDIADILITDVLRKYVVDKVDPKFEEKKPTVREIRMAMKAGVPPPLPKKIKISGHSRPDETKTRIGFLYTFWAGKTLADLNGDSCRKYAEGRTTPQQARRELEELRAAINHHRAEGLHDRIVSVVLPDKSQSRLRYLERDEAARMIRSAWRYREVQNFRATDRYTRRHVARFMVVAGYMGSRASVICGASLAEKRPEGEPWVDLVNGIFYGRPEGERETNKRKQTVRIPRPLLAHLRRWKRKGQRYVVEWNGKPIARVIKAHNAVVIDTNVGADVTPHTWRHTAATWLMQRNADLWEASEFLGMTPEVLLRVYGHHRTDRLKSVHRAIDKRERREKVMVSVVDRQKRRDEAG